MNKDDYKSAMSCVRHSEDFTERIMNMATERTKRSMKTKGKRLAIAAACVVLLAAGLFGGNVISVRRGAAGNGFMWSYLVPAIALAYMFVYSAFLSKPPADIEERVK